MNSVLRLFTYTGTELQITRHGLWKEQKFYSFPKELQNEVDFALSSLSGSFLYLRIDNHHILVTVAAENLYDSPINVEQRVAHAHFTSDERILLLFTQRASVVYVDTLSGRVINESILSHGELGGKYEVYEFECILKITTEQGDVVFYDLPMRYESDLLEYAENVPQFIVENAIFEDYEKPKVIKETKPQSEEPKSSEDVLRLSLQLQKRSRYIQNRLAVFHNRRNSLLERLKCLAETSSNISGLAQSCEHRLVKCFKRISSLIEKADQDHDKYCQYLALTEKVSKTYKYLSGPLDYSPDFQEHLSREYRVDFVNALAVIEDNIKKLEEFASTM